MHPRFHLRWLRLALLAVFLPTITAWADDDPELERGRVILKRVSDRLKEPGGDRDKLRNDFLSLRRRFPGTEVDLKAGEMLRQMPSALDLLDPKNIPPLEKFSWQPKEMVAVLGEHLGRHGNPVNCVAFSPDGSLLVSGGGSYLRVWNPATMRLIQLLGYSNPYSRAFSKDGKMLAVCSSGPAAALYDVAPGDAPLRLRWSVGAGTVACYSVVFHPDMKSFAVACFDNHARIYDAGAKTAPEPILLQGHEEAVQAVAYSPDGKILATGSADQTVRLWDATVPIPKEKASLAGHPSPITAMTFNPAGSTLAAACADSTIHLWTIPAPPKGGKPRTGFELKAGHIYNLSFSATGQTLAAACADGTARLWSVNATPRPRERFKMEGHAGAVVGVAYSPDNKLIATGGADWTCRTWDATGAAPKERFVPWSHLSHVYSSSFSPDCQSLASGSLDKVLRLWDVNRSEPRTRNYIKGDSIPIYAITYSPDGGRLAVSGTNATVRQWDSATGKPLRSCSGLPGAPSGLAYAPDGKSLLVHHGPLAFLYDAQSGELSRQLTGHTTNIFNAGFSPDGKKVVTCAGNLLYKDGKVVEINKEPQYTDTTVRIWDAESANEVTVIKGHKKPVYRTFYSPDGKYLFSGGAEGMMVRRETANLNGPETPAFPGVSPVSYGFMYSPDGSKMLTMYGGSLKLWDVASWKPVWEGAMAETVGNVTFASDSRHLAVSLGTGVIYILRLGAPETK